MKKLTFSLLAVSLLLAQPQLMAQIKYPQTLKTDQVDTYYDTKIADPYRWLEDDRSAETAAWVQAENKITYDYLEKIPFRNDIHNRLSHIWNFPKYGVPFEKNGYYFFYKNDGLQNQSTLYMQKGLDAKPEVLLDPNTLAKDGTVAISALALSKDMKYLAYSTSAAGSDWQDIYVMEIANKQLLKDKVEWVKFSGIAWAGNGFYYSSYPNPSVGKEFSKKNEHHKVYYHKLGTSAKTDELVFGDFDHALRNYSAATSEDEKYLVISASEGTSGNSLYIKDLQNPKSELIEVVKNFGNDYSFVDAVGDNLYFVSNYRAPKYQLLSINIKDLKNWKTIIPEANEVLQGVNLAGGKWVAQYMKDATNRLYVYNLQGAKQYEIQLPGLGTVNGVSGSKNSATLLYGFVSFTQASTIYRYDLKTKKSTIMHKPKVDFASANYVTEQVFYTSADGTKIPMFITHKKGLVLNGNNPTWLYGYGGFQIPITPEFKIDRLPFLEQGGIYAVANLRGGGEYGENWHQAGTKMNKQNVFNDFIAAAEFLINEKYTNKNKLAIMGRSNGGLLVGAAITQRPDLYKVAFPGVGVLDMLRFHKFTIGWAWTGDYGSSEESKEMFNYLYKYSPLHNVRENVDYPATFITTADHDDRVVPAHSFKFAATMQEKYKGNNPILIRIDVDAGHGSGKPTAKQIDESADVLAFMMYQLDMKPDWSKAVEKKSTPVKTKKKSLKKA